MIWTARMDTRHFLEGRRKDGGSLRMAIGARVALYAGQRLLPTCDRHLGGDQLESLKIWLVNDFFGVCAPHSQLSHMNFVLSPHGPNAT